MSTDTKKKGITDGFTDTNLRLFYDKPVSHYNTKNKNSLDVVSFINDFDVKEEFTNSQKNNECKLVYEY